MSRSHLALALTLAIAACSSSSDNKNPPATGCPSPCTPPSICDPATRQCLPPSQVCPQGCPAGTTCNPASKQCEPDATPAGCNPPCSGAMICDEATKACVPNPNAGQCTPQCGKNAYCNAQKLCLCNGGFSDCNNNLGKGLDGCECAGACDGAKCQGEVSTGCEPNVVNDCGDATRYCNVDQCVACPDNKYNCDGWQDCEADFDCAKDGCEQFGSKTCVSQNQFCDKNKTCQQCPPGTFNCMRTGGTCECTTKCDGSKCEDECTSVTGCADNTKWCDFGVCKPCLNGRFNCDGAGNCECDDKGCNGTDCVGARACDYYDQDACGGDSTKWCYQNECKDCNDKLNCNGTKGCECDLSGCNGKQCAGKCSGGEC